jgi:hypothetical protein
LVLEEDAPAPLAGAGVSLEQVAAPSEGVGASPNIEVRVRLQQGVLLCNGRLEGDLVLLNKGLEPAQFKIELTVLGQPKALIDPIEGPLLPGGQEQRLARSIVIQHPASPQFALKQGLQTLCVAVSTWRAPAEIVRVDCPFRVAVCYRHLWVEVEP